MGKDINISSNGFRINAYLAEPQGIVKGCLIVIHEVWGLNDHTKDIADRFAKKGYVSLAPELLELEGLTKNDITELQAALFSKDPAERDKAQPKLRAILAPTQSPDFAKNTMSKLKECFEYLYKINQNVSVVGFCFGGSYSFSLAANEPRLKSSIPFYGHCDLSVDELKKVKCPIMAFYGENDHRLTVDLDDLESRMSQAGVDFKKYVYPNCAHAFFNDSNPLTYNEPASKDAFNKALEFLAKN
jgi:carboxymethylenebutenolidase